MESKHADLLPAPTIEEAEPSKTPGMEIIIVDRLGPEGATLNIQYPTIKEGDIVRVWESNPSYPFDVTGTVPKGADIITFKVPKSTLTNVENSLTYQYGLLDEEGGWVTVSLMKTYLKQAITPPRLPAPFIKGTEPSDGTMEVVIVDELGPEGATLIIRYSEITEGDRVRIRVGIDGYYESLYIIRKNETEIHTKIPLEKLKNDIQIITVSYMTVDQNGKILNISDSKAYFKKPGYAGS